MQREQVLLLYDQYADSVFRLAFSYLKSREDAEDAVQTTFLKLIKGQSVPFQGKEHAYLMQLTANHCKDVLRERKRHCTDELSDELPFLQKENRELYWSIQHLPEKYSVALCLHYYEGYTINEISQILRCPPSTVSMRLHRARKLLKKELD